MELIERAVCGDAEAGRLIFPCIVEPLADAFDPDLCNVYVGVFACIFGRVQPELQQQNLIERFERVRAPRRFTGPDPARVFVLSRVTLGADVAVTSIVLDAAKKRFPSADIVFAGPRKNYELFAGDERIRHMDVPYHRSGTLAERLSVWPQLREALDHPEALVIDPDSRLTQLGLLPVCAQERYLFYESRSYGGDSADSLVTLTQRWVAETLDIEDARAWIRPAAGPGRRADITVSLGVGENDNKRVADPFETELLRLIGRRGGRIVVDSGQGGEEADRVRRAIAQSGIQAEIFSGPFAGFAAHIACSRFFIGYDSAGGHVAAAAGTPLVSIFAGALCERTFQRWRPTGPGPAKVLLVQENDTPESVLANVEQALGLQ
ncbi:MAG TPA: glycosyltransferase family 9 protein [Bryobacteraceae bacterium]|nr:glycosyltransferase family 9 protein [Bryobacteraceae bacterium]